jgi:hypothetical protein
MSCADGWASRPYPTLAEDQEATTPPFLPNEASWKMRRYGRKRRNVNNLRRLQKNDNWLRYFGFKGVEKGTSEIERPTIYPLEGGNGRDARSTGGHIQEDGRDGARPSNIHAGARTAGTAGPTNDWRPREKNVCETNSPVNRAFCKDLERGALGGLGMGGRGGPLWTLWTVGGQTWTYTDLHGRYTDADAMAWGIFELMKAAGCLKGCWCEERPFDKLRMMGRGRGGCDRKYTGAGNLFLLFVGEDAFDAGVGGEPEEGDGDEEGVGEPGVDEGEGDGEEVERGREFAFPVVADGGGEEGVGALLFDDGGLQNVVGDGGHEEDEAVDGGGYLPEMVFADPGGGEREKREPEKQVEVRPEDAAADVFGGLEEVVMVVPVDADVDETEDVAEEDGQERFQCGEVGGVRDFQFQHHDGDDDREDAVAEGFEPGGFHGAGAGCPKATAFAERKVVAGRRSWTEKAQLTRREGVLLVA